MDEKQVAEFEEIDAQITGLHKELSKLSTKNADTPMNSFKLTVINQALERANDVLGLTLQPIPNFSQFDDDSVPTNSDAVLVLAQYINSLNVLLKRNVLRLPSGSWVWVLDRKTSSRRSRTPKFDD
jgi:hypothetical protein